MSDKREHKRKDVEARVEVLHPEIGVVKAHTRDISNGGLFLVLNEHSDYPIGSVMQIRLVDSANTDIVFNMEVIHKQDNGLGLMFIDYTLDGKQQQMDSLRDLWRRNKT